MAYFEDLSTYRYDTSGEEVLSIERGFIVFTPAYTRLNIGWLDAAQIYSQGAVPAELISSLAWLASGQRINVMRGFHVCQFCRSADTEIRGNGELRVPGEPGVMYAAPIMVNHYVAEHGYAPPQEFITAALAYSAAGDRLDEPSWIPADAKRELY